MTDVLPTRTACPAAMEAYLDAHAQGLIRISEPATVREVLHRADDFTPDNALTALVPLGRAALRILARGGVVLPPVLASATGAPHREVRRVVARYVSPARVDAMRETIVQSTRARAAEVADRLGREGVADLATDVTRQIAPRVFSHLTGLPTPPVDLLRRWGQDSLELFWGVPDEDRQEALATSAVDLFDWLRAAVAAGPPDGLFPTLHAAGMDRPRLLSLAFFLVIAGQETTAMLGDTTLYRALREQGLWARLAGDLDLAASQVRHVLAHESSVPTWRRIAARDTELAGRAVPAGTALLLELSGPSRGRQRPDHTLAFGHGVHRCLGARLAELETTLVLAHTAAALPDLVPAPAEPEWFRLLSFQAPRTVEVKVA